MVFLKGKEVNKAYLVKMTTAIAFVCFESIFNLFRKRFSPRKLEYNDEESFF